MSLDTLVTTLGLPGVVLGAALEGEIVTFFGGVLAHRGLLPLEGVALAAALGAALSDNLLFLASRFGTRRPFFARLLARMPAGGPAPRMRAALERHPDRFTFAARFVYGGRMVGQGLLGASSIPWGRYALVNAAASLLWGHLVAWAGYLVGASIGRVFGHLALPHHLLVALAVFAALALAVLALRHLRRTP
ncbi:DedA family protein [Pseudoroseicyclus aestuarii]|uniref:Membrane protein DedA with SNARE-associated domain n=1 Tax=Pseudoroseicyclus aestuarii TaxID=1795041 RepID=A0A318SPG0_9RHOB|nr:VTT domain-containing protein [Pseudoroseicyclus aestuarii]PYE82526.1 membrane protein DedA with SNARE-associated domain [Pseudoroseicyclus aestuarii]